MLMSNSSGNFEFDWVVGFDGDHVFFSVSDEAALVVQANGESTKWIAYELEADARIISTQSAIPWGSYFNCTCNPPHDPQQLSACSMSPAPPSLVCACLGMWFHEQTLPCGLSFLVAPASWSHPMFQQSARTARLACSTGAFTTTAPSAK